MEKPILYCDCDGVILNTIDVAFNMMRELGYDIENKKQINDFFKNEIEWIDVFDRAKVINNSIDKIKLLKESSIFSDIIILTKLSGGYDEERLKRDLFRECLPDIRVITLQFGIQKATIVNARNNVLIDDEKNNCINWKDNNGTAVLFSSDSDFKNNIVNDLMDIPKTQGVKKLLKTRNF